MPPISHRSIEGWLRSDLWCQHNRWASKTLYALAIPDASAQQRNLRTIGDLAKYPGCASGLSHEFLNRSDGWPGLVRTYALPQQPRGLDHGLAYEALAARQIDVMDIYSTDAKIEKYKLRVLQDDKHYFPEYAAVLVYRLDVPKRFPQAWAALAKLQGKITPLAMVPMNAQAELDGKGFPEIASAFVAQAGSASPAKTAPANFWSRLFGADFWRLTREHLLLVFASLAAAIAISIRSVSGLRARRTRRSPFSRPWD